MTKKHYYRVAENMDAVPLRDHLEHGFETKYQFRDAVRLLLNRWHGREGEAISIKNNFVLLHFCDSLGGLHEEAWLPNFLLTPIPPPKYLHRQERDETEEEIDDAFGF